MTPISQALVSNPTGYVYTSQEFADEMAKQETLHVLRTAIMDQQELLKKAQAWLAARSNP